MLKATISRRDTTTEIPTNRSRKEELGIVHRENVRLELDERVRIKGRIVQS